MKINRSVERSIEMLKLISDSEGMTLGEIIAEMEIPKSSAFDIIQTLLATGMINCVEGAQKKYIIGLESFKIGISYERDMLKISQKYLKILADSLNRTVFLGIIKDGEVIYLDKREPNSSIITTATLGSRNPVHCTALGKALLFEEKKENILKILHEKGMEAKTDKTITDPEKFYENLEYWKHKGFAVDDQEIEKNQLCLSAPIHDVSGKIIAAISASGFYNPDEDVEKVGNTLKEVTLKISRELGYKK